MSDIVDSLWNRRRAIVGVPNPHWPRYMQSGQFAVPALPLFGPADTFFTIGSCFAVEIRQALIENGLTCLPDYGRVVFDQARVKIGKLPERQNMNYYNTFTIRQEVERAAGIWTQGADDIWEIPGHTIRDGSLREGDGTVYQDPYRRAVFAPTPEELRAATAQIDRVMSEGMRRASVFVITLGLTEVFVKTDNGLVANQAPKRDAVKAKAQFHVSTFGENLHNIERSVELIQRINPKAQIVISVSPVALARTFSNDDVYLANLRSKSTLLVVAREICERFANCHYFPAFEVVTNTGRTAFLKDGRHVKPSVVNSIVALFMASTFEDRMKAPAPDSASRAASSEFIG